jgi:hypothetical protein
MTLARTPQRWFYRSTQFFAALLGRVGQADMAEAREVLGPELFQVFAAMPGQYRLHMLAVYRRVREAGCDDPDVWKAALLHDAGKHDPHSGRYVSLPYRVVIVLLAALPGGKALLARLATPGQGGPTARGMALRYPFYLSGYHTHLGAELAEHHGASATVVTLIAHHHDHSPQVHSPQLQALQAADEQS